MNANPLYGIPGLAGILASQQMQQERAASGMQQATQGIGLLAHIQEQQQAAETKQVLEASGGDVTKAIPVLVQKGNIKGAFMLSQMQEHQAKTEQLSRVNAFRSPGNLSQFMTGGTPAQAEIPPASDEIGGGPGRPAIPATQGQIDPKKLLFGALAAGVVDPLAYAKEQITEQKPQFAPSRSPGYFQNGQWVATPENQTPQTPSPLARLISEKAALPPNDPRHRMYEAAITHVTNPQAQRIIIPPQPREEPPVQTWTDGSGKLWERERGGEWRPAKITEGGGAMTPKVLPGAAAAVKKADKASDEAKTYDAIIQQIDDMKTHVKNSEGVVSGTVGPKGALNRVYEVGAGVVGADIPTPALDLQNKKELIIANVRKLVAGGGQFSNQDALRVEHALGTGMMANPNNTIRALDGLKKFIQNKRGTAPVTNEPPAAGKPRAEDFFR